MTPAALVTRSGNFLPSIKKNRCMESMSSAQTRRPLRSLYVPLPVALFGQGDFYLLRASGKSMIEAGIDPGDLVVVRKQNTAEEGDIVVALVDNETTLKRFYRDKKHRCIRLHPENSKMKDIYVQDCTIQGVAQNVIKTL